MKGYFTGKQGFVIRYVSDKSVMSLGMDGKKWIDSCVSVARARQYVKMGLWVRCAAPAVRAPNEQAPIKRAKISGTYVVTITPQEDHYGYNCRAGEGFTMEFWGKSREDAISNARVWWRREGAGGPDAQIKAKFRASLKK